MSIGRPDRCVDLATQRWVRLTGHRVDVADHPWLAGPTGAPDVVSDRWVCAEARRLGGTATPAESSAGLLASVAELAGATFVPDRLHGVIRDFYERTTGWRMQVWSEWSTLARPFGWALSRVFAHRLQQLALPLRPLETAYGVDSAVVAVRGRDTHLGTAWVRRLRATGQVLYSGWYTTALLPGSDQPSVRVVFPLPNGSLIVFLRPANTGRGGLRLVSPLGRFGQDGAYLVVRDRTGGRAWARRVPIAERFDVYVDNDGVLRTDHDLRLWATPALRLRYRMDPIAAALGD